MYNGLNMKKANPNLRKYQDKKQSIKDKIELNRLRKKFNIPEEIEFNFDLLAGDSPLCGTGSSGGGIIDDSVEDGVYVFPGPIITLDGEPVTGPPIEDC